MDQVAALYIDELGPYPKLLGADMCWGESRDARLYAGPWPVVAHPPCGPWGTMHHLATKQDPECGRAAIRQVREFGGVVEQPRGSRLFAACGVSQQDLWTVEQVQWGHPCRKHTWLYFVGVPTDVIADAILPWTRERREPTHQLRARHNGTAATEPYKMASKEIRRRTPVAFAEWLIHLARRARPWSSVADLERVEPSLDERKRATR